MRASAAIVTIAVLVFAGVISLTTSVRASGPSSAGYALENGDVNGDESRDLSDPIYLLDHLFLGGPAPLPLAWCDDEEPAALNGDSNGDGAVNLGDSVQLLAWLFSGGPSPVDACGEGGDGSGAHHGRCRNRLAPPDSRAYGKTLTQWLAIYWKWYYGTNQDPAQSKVGKVRLLPIPAGDVLGGSGTPEDPAQIRGRIEVNLRPDTPFVLPLFAWTRERYNNGTPDDPPIPDDLLLASVSPNFTLDGCPLINDRNERKFYIPTTPYNRPVVYPQPTSYGSIAMLAFQGCGFVAHPLPPGVHEIHLFESYILADPPAGISPFGVIYDNTWVITVSRH